MGLSVLRKTRTRDKPLAAQTAHVRPNSCMPIQNVTLQICDDVEAAAAHVTKERLRSLVLHRMNQEVTLEFVAFSALFTHVWKAVNVRLLMCLKSCNGRKHLATFVANESLCLPSVQLHMLVETAFS